MQHIHSMTVSYLGPNSSTTLLAEESSARRLCLDSCPSSNGLPIIHSSCASSSALKAVQRQMVSKKLRYNIVQQTVQNHNSVTIDNSYWQIRGSNPTTDRMCVLHTNSTVKNSLRQGVHTLLHSLGRPSIGQ